MTPAAKKELSSKTAVPDLSRLRKNMVRTQLEARGISDQQVLEAMRSVPRHLFVPEALTHRAYDDAPLPIGYGQTISQPYVVAWITQNLEVSSGMHVLEIGVGSGYQAAILAFLGCTVFGIERLRQIYQLTFTRLKKMGLRSIHLHNGDGTLGLKQAAPFDRIIVSAGGPEIPKPLFEQLSEDGIMLIPVGARPRAQRLLKICKSHGKATVEDLGPAEFVDLVGNHGW